MYCIYNLNSLDKNTIFEPVREKTNNLRSDQVRHKPGCTVTEARVFYDFFNTISILDGELFKFFGTAANDDRLVIEMDGDLMIRGGGEMIANNLEVYGRYYCHFGTRSRNK